MSDRSYFGRMETTDRRWEIENDHRAGLERQICGCLADRGSRACKQRTGKPDRAFRVSRVLLRRRQLQGQSALGAAHDRGRAALHSRWLVKSDGPPDRRARCCATFGPATSWSYPRDAGIETMRPRA